MTGLLPALTRPNAFTNNYDAYGNTEYNRNNWDFKVNYNPTDKAMVWGRYSLSPMDIVAPLVLGPAGGDAFGGGNPGHAGGRVQSTAAGFTYTLSPTLLVDGNVGYTRQNIGANGDPEDGLFGLDVLKIPGTNGVGPNYYGIPGFQVTGVANIGNTSTGSPFQFRDNQYTSGHQPEQDQGRAQPALRLRIRQVRAEPLPAAGRNLRHGARHLRLRRHADRAERRRGGQLQRRAGQLLGAVPARLPSRIGKITQFQNPNALRFSDWAFYARDQWQVTRNLTVNYGLRWEYYPIFSHDHYGAVRYDPAPTPF